MYEQIKKRFWLFWIIIVVVGLILLTKNLEAQEVRDLHIDVFGNGNMLMMGETELAFIYGNEPFGFKGAGFQIITLTGDTLEITIKRKQ